MNRNDLYASLSDLEATFTSILYRDKCSMNIVYCVPHHKSAGKTPWCACFVSRS